MARVVDSRTLRTLYTKEQFADILAFLKDELQAKFPQWNALNDDDFGTVLLELFAGIADMFRFYQNVTAVESFPCLARLRESLFRHAKWFAYMPKPAGAARTDLTFTVSNPAQGATIPFGTRVATPDGEVVFETTDTLVIAPGEADGTVGAVHAHHVREEQVGISTGERNQRFALAQSPLVVLSSADRSNHLPHVRVWVGGEEWEQVQSLVWASELGGAEDQAFTVEIEADNTAYVVFGDGVFGEIPPEGAQIIASYLVGGGARGNVGAHTLTKLVGNLTNVGAVTNPSAATGGHDRESEEELRRNIPSQVITRGRAVTKSDYKRLLEAFGEVAKVNVHHPQANIVEVYVLPQGGGLPSDELKQRLAEFLDNIRMITEDVRILDPELVEVDIEAEIWCEQGYTPHEVATEVYEKLKEHIGQPEFARRLYPSDVYALIQQVPGIVKVDVNKLARSTDPTDVTAIICEPDEILVEGRIRILSHTYMED